MPPWPDLVHPSPSIPAQVHYTCCRAWASSKPGGRGRIPPPGTCLTPSPKAGSHHPMLRQDTPQPLPELHGWERPGATSGHPCLCPTACPPPHPTSHPQNLRLPSQLLHTPSHVQGGQGAKHFLGGSLGITLPHRECGGRGREPMLQGCSRTMDKDSCVVARLLMSTAVCTSGTSPRGVVPWPTGARLPGPGSSCAGSTGSALWAKQDPHWELAPCPETGMSLGPVENTGDGTHESRAMAGGDSTA